jgi:uncharacterized membrane protein
LRPDLANHRANDPDIPRAIDSATDSAIDSAVEHANEPADDRIMDPNFDPRMLIPQPQARRGAHLVALASLLALIALCLAWEWWLAPLRPGGSALLLKVVPLLLPVRGLIRRDRYTLQWSSMLILLYLAEGVVRGLTDRPPSNFLAWAETALSAIYFVCAVAYLTPYKRAARQRARASSHI